MLATVYSGAVQGVDAYQVEVNAGHDQLLFPTYKTNKLPFFS
jgi:hypothetical protein